MAVVITFSLGFWRLSENTGFSGQFYCGFIQILSTSILFHSLDYSLLLRLSLCVCVCAELNWMFVFNSIWPWHCLMSGYPQGQGHNSGWESVCCFELLLHCRVDGVVEALVKAPWYKHNMYGCIVKQMMTAFHASFFIDLVGVESFI